MLALVVTACLDGAATFAARAEQPFTPLLVWPDRGPRNYLTTDQLTVLEYALDAYEGYRLAAIDHAFRSPPDPLVFVFAKSS